MSLEAFLTGFFNGKAEIISKRKDEGEKYFNDQAARAKRIYQEQIGQRRERLQQLTQASNRLIHTANMPDHIVRGLVSAGPEAINTALELFEKVPQHDWSASDWEDIYSTSQFYAQEYNEDLTTFLGRTVGLIGENYRATKETGGDLQSAFMASALGYNAKDRARSRLDEMEVAPGFSASDVLDMEGRPLTQSDAGSTYAGPVPRAFLDIAGSNQEPLSAKEQLDWRNKYRNLENEYIDQIATEEFGRRYEAYMLEATDPHGQLIQETEPKLDALKADPNIRAAARAQAAQEFATIVGPETSTRLNFFQPILAEVMPAPTPQRPSEPTERTVGVPGGLSMGEPTIGTEVPVSEPPMASEAAPTERRGPIEAGASRITSYQDGRQQQDVEGRESMGMPAPSTNESIMQDLERQSADPEGRVASRNVAGVTPPEREGPGLFARGMEKMKGVLEGLRSSGTPVQERAPAQRGRESRPGDLPRGWSVNSQNQIATDTGRLVQPIGVSPNTLNWVYKDLQTGEEFEVPN